MTVAEHFVRAPTAQEPDDISVDLGAEEGHSPSCAQTPGGDVGRKETQVCGTESQDSDAEGVSDVKGCDPAPRSAIEVDTEGCVGGCPKGPQVNDAAGQGEDGAEVGVARGGKPNNFTADAAVNQSIMFLTTHDLSGYIIGERYSSLRSNYFGRRSSSTKKSFLDYDMLVLPVHYSQNHWYIAVAVCPGEEVDAGNA